MITVRDNTDSAPGTNGNHAPRESWFLDEPSFQRMLAMERKRADRSGRRFVLMLLDCGILLKAGGRHSEEFERTLSALFDSTRDTDIKGWHAADSVLGVIFTEIGAADGRFVAHALLDKVSAALSRSLSIEQINELRLSFHVYPEDWDHNGSGGLADSVLYPDLQSNNGARKASLGMKRALDIAGSLAALIVLSPLFALIAAAVKLTSRGPVLFRQERIGRFGKRFTFLKFRSMSVAGDPRVHEEFIKRFIKDTDGAARVSPDGPVVHKLIDDPRVTPVGRLLRRTSLDELPQFINVLRGEMSLVGPRPPIPYEFRCYDNWHRQRVLAVKPGITGLWQVEGRSRVKFNDMVRLDLKYARTWSLWMDMKILLRTPGAVLSGNGAY